MGILIDMCEAHGAADEEQLPTLQWSMGRGAWHAFHAALIQCDVILLMPGTTVHEFNGLPVVVDESLEGWELETEAAAGFRRYGK